MAGESFTPTIVVVDGDAQRRSVMQQLATELGFDVEAVDSQKRALARLRSNLPDILWSGCALPDAPLAEFVGVVRAAFPSLPVLLLVDDEHWDDALDLVDGGAFDVIRDEDDPRLQKAALRRALADARARARVMDERGKILGATTHLSTLGAAVSEMLSAVAGTFKESMGRPDISLRQVETVCATAMSRFFDGVPVVIMALERPSMVLWPRGSSHALDGHDALSSKGMVFTKDKDGWREALAGISSNRAFTGQVRDAYGARHCFLAPLGPDEEPYGVAAFLPQHANPPTPEDEELLTEISLHAGWCIRMARHFRAVLRRSGGGGSFTLAG